MTKLADYIVSFVFQTDRQTERQDNPQKTTRQKERKRVEGEIEREPGIMGPRPEGHVQSEQ